MYRSRLDQVQKLLQARAQSNNTPITKSKMVIHAIIEIMVMYSVLVRNNKYLNRTA